ncbi:MAG: SDR family oxidoreductase [Alphaproteobacteria bacterium]|nr:SDR family oxidoreductase [Alphaproteobacteria bacterium]
MDLHLKDKRVVVTGGSRGIGYAIAAAFAEEGSHVSICARGRDALDAAADKLRAHGTTIHAQPTDISDPVAIEDYIEAAASALGGIDILINNPSAFGYADTEEHWQSGIGVDLMGLLRCSWKAIPHMEESGGGAIIHISSISGLKPTRRSPAYAAVKAAVIQYTTSQALILAEKSIRVNTIAPGSVEFPGGLWEQRKTSDPATYNAALGAIPFGRMGRPEEIADAALFLASDRAGWITGECVSVDGGQRLTG